MPPKLYTRLLLYIVVLSTMFLGVRHYWKLFWRESSRFIGGSAIRREGYGNNNNNYGTGRAARYVVVDVAVESCWHVYGYTLWCSRSGGLIPPVDGQRAAQTTVHRRVQKDMAGSLLVDWFGTAQFLQLEMLQEQQGTSGQCVSSISWSPGSFQTWQGLHFETQDITGENNLPCVTDITVLFGEDCVDPRSEWNLLRDKPLPVSSSTRRNDPVDCYLSYRSGGGRWARPVLKLDAAGQFKVVQLADLHMGVGPGKCIDEFPEHSKSEGPCLADPKTLTFVESVLDTESPQLVVFTGDQIMGDKSRYDSETTLLKALAPVLERHIPWCLVWGNHDDEGSLSRWELSRFAETLPLSLFKISPRDTGDSSFGVGNYFHQVFSDNGEEKPAITLYFLDSHKYSRTGKLYPGYDWIKEAQWDYVKQLYDKAIAPFADAATETSQERQLSMAFFHIPLPEYGDFQSQSNPAEQNPMLGQHKEGLTAPKYNSGGLTTLQHMRVQATSCGHDHCNDYCLQDDSTGDKIWLCFGGSAGEGAYAGYGGTERRIRTFNFDTTSGRIETWKRLNGSPQNAFDYQVLVDLGHPAGLDVL
ncbi:phosphoprotein phosphatase KNAG_0B05860 [Huiozyma naganishii CBS 8797]|uniref:Calcineurin-like phosphoesterase domain-containing protein n=1 Tax=Huiozyma naganishii (strain ATCC MYA-139 / BCRC 22969 / CBS 8797 / KCTC 17520 / NBRC 10181 / NCYC 3082 / Yp74L-3) TaxID=1071383 RepID=J7RVR3_HUIN7|nr:hypothetical protein KNAG_0B05860 [Kazachstania naganishii CBS 8797]CCK69017.1 hypothetical protein KNAG_0B05860 [Kazachstania naganishii CBS 8797]